MFDSFIKMSADKLKKLPGFAYLLPVVTTLYGMAFGSASAVGGTVATLLICWGVYRLGGKLDGPLYDSLFGAERSHTRLPVIEARQRELDALRDEVSRMIFGRAGVTNFRDAREHKKVTRTGPTTLYRRCVTLLKPTKLWEQQVKGLLDISKAARGLVVLLPLLAGILALPSELFSFSSRVQTGFVTARQNLGPFSMPWIHLLGAAAAILVYLVTRYHHHRRLYTLVARHVTTVTLSNGDIRAEIVDDPVIVCAAGERSDQRGFAQAGVVG